MLQNSDLKSSSVTAPNLKTFHTLYPHCFDAVG